MKRRFESRQRVERPRDTPSAHTKMIMGVRRNDARDFLGSHLAQTSSMPGFHITKSCFGLCCQNRLGLYIDLRGLSTS